MARAVAICVPEMQPEETQEVNVSEAEIWLDACVSRGVLGALLKVTVPPCPWVMV